MIHSPNKIAVLLVVIMLSFTVIVTGCTSKTEGTAESTGTAEPTPEATEAPEGPVTLKILTQDANDPNYSYADGKTYPIIEELEKRTNVKIDWQVATPGENYWKLIETTLAAGVNLPDIALLKYDASPKQALILANQGVIIDLKPLIDQYAPNIKKMYFETLPEAAKQILTEDGKMYWLSYPSKNEAIFFNVMVRMDWLEKAGITKVPETTDEFEAMLRAFQDKDVNGNGKRDEVFTSTDPYMTVLQFADAFGVPMGSADGRDFIVPDDSGKLYNSLLTDNGKQLLQYLNKLFAEGLLDPDSASITFDKFLARLGQNAVSATNGYWFYPENVFSSNMNGITGTQYVPLSKLAGPEGKFGTIMQATGVSGSRFVITKDAKDPVAAIKFLDYLYTVDAFRLRSNGIEGVHYTVEADGTLKPTESFAQALKDNPAAKNAIGANGWASLPGYQIATFDDFLKTNATLNVPYQVDPARETLKNPIHPETKYATPTLEELDELQAIGDEAISYIQEMEFKFLVGEESFDKWDEFVVKANDLGMDKLIAIRQKMYDRYTK